MNKIGILTSGGDAPGMNAAIRSIVKSGINSQIKVIGIENGFEGLIDGQFIELNSSSIKNIIQRGGTILKSARSKRFLEKSYRKKAMDHLFNNEINGLIVLGGNGTFKGASIFTIEFDFPIIGIPCTIDNDLYGTDFSIGYDTAINTAVDAIDKIRDTAESHNRLFFIEVMGRDSGMIALTSGIAGGAEEIMIPETFFNIKQLVGKLKDLKNRDNSSIIVVVAEGDEEGGAFKISEQVKKDLPDFDIRTTTLGHIQRGGKPTCMDRVLACQLGSAAVEALLEGKRNLMVGVVNQKIKLTDFSLSIVRKRKINSELLKFL